ncbi:hypothetical protein ACSBR2_029107 [Camellia fascicularis]
MRKATKNVRLRELDAPADTQIYMALAVVYHENEILGAYANEFNPMRFTKVRKHIGAFVPFSLGARICVGQNVAMAEAKIVLAMIIRWYSFVVSPSYAHAPIQYITWQPQHGAYILFKNIAS